MTSSITPTALEGYDIHRWTDGTITEFAIRRMSDGRPFRAESPLVQLYHATEDRGPYVLTTSSEGMELELLGIYVQLLTDVNAEAIAEVTK